MDPDLLPGRETVDLPGRPTCENCLAWAEDGLAVATGENVHIITSNQSNSRRDLLQRPWHIDTVRINLFTLADWPERELVTIDHASIGEEQSDSTVVALAWSAPGLGIHRRSVLAVLTSNLRLSLWESDGTPGQWKRTLVVNHLLQAGEIGHSGTDTTNLDARKLRIRAFTWLDPLFISTTNKWGMHYLAIANDSREVFVMSIGKFQSNTAGEWDVKTVWHDAIPISSFSGDGNLDQTELQRRIRDDAPITTLSHQGWAIPSDVVSTRQPEGQIASEIVVSRGIHSVQSTRLAFQISLPANGPISIKTCRYSSNSSRERRERLFSDAWSNIPRPEGLPSFVVNTPKTPWSRDWSRWKNSLQKKVTEYNQTYNLRDHYRIRFWAFAYSADLNLIATCVTLHPLDMFEYTTPVTEKSLIVFRTFLPPSQLATTQELLAFKSENEIISQILKFLEAYERAHILDNDTDEMVLHIWKLRSRRLQNEDFELQVHGQGSVEGINTSQTEVLHPEGHVPKCEACETPFEYDFSSQLPIARCETGHYFPCCSLSLIALQEPGISKNCSACDRIFLDLVKFQTNVGPSLVRALFDEFDVCPFCDGKFRG